jgi:hypothetical protein
MKNASYPGITNGIILSGGYSNSNYGFQLAIDDDPTGWIAIRQKGTNGWAAWKKIPLYDGTNASGTWPISISGNANYASSAGSAPASDVYDWAKASTKPSYDFSEIGTGPIKIGDGANYIEYRTTNSWNAGIYYHTNGDEATVFANSNTRASWIFANTNPESRTLWTSLSPAMHIKNGKVAIGKLIPNSSYLTHQLEVAGSASFTGQVYGQNWTVTSTQPSSGPITWYNTGTRV